MAVAPNTTFSSGAIFTAAQANAFPFGIVGYNQRSSGNITLGTTIADLTGLTTTFTAIANRGYKVTFTALVQKSSAAGLIDLYLTKGDNTQLAEYFTYLSSGEFQTMSFSFVVTGLTAGTQTLKMRGLVDVAGGTVYASGLNVAVFIVEDIGGV
jgi:hypothetical protein